MRSAKANWVLAVHGAGSLRAAGPRQLYGLVYGAGALSRGGRAQNYAAHVRSLRILMLKTMINRKQYKRI